MITEGNALRLLSYYNQHLVHLVLKFTIWVEPVNHRQQSTCMFVLANAHCRQGILEVTERIWGRVRVRVYRLAEMLIGSMMLAEQKVTFSREQVHGKTILSKCNGLFVSIDGISTVTR